MVRMPDPEPLTMKETAAALAWSLRSTVRKARLGRARLDDALLALGLEILGEELAEHLRLCGITLHKSPPGPNHSIPPRAP